MKLTMVLLTAAILTANAEGFSQKVSFNGKNVELLSIFSSIEKQTGYMTVGSMELLKQSGKVSLAVRDMPLETLLQLILKDQPIDYKISEKTIFLFKRPGVVPPASSAGAGSVALVNARVAPIKVRGSVTGFNDLPLMGASVNIVGKNDFFLTDVHGIFELTASKGDRLRITYIGYQPVEWKVTGESVRIEMKPVDAKLDDVEVVINTGYQKFKPNEMVGAVEVFNEKALQKQVGTNILQRLKGLSTAIMFENKVTPSSASGNPHSVLNMTVRGWSTINGPTDPLIILDNFPYQGNIDNINPNDVESIVLLKDAAATSVWGARAGNGVIVINTRRGKYGAKTSFNFNSTVSYTPKPDLSKLPLLNSASYIDQELFYAGRDPQQHVINRFARTPAVQVMLDKKRGLITAEDSAAKIDYLKSIDSRQQWDEYIYQPAVLQDYSLNASGGSASMAWNISAGYSKSQTRTQANNERTTLTIGNNFKINNKLELHVRANYSNSKAKSGAPEFNAISAADNGQSRKIPYMQLADEQGKPVNLLKKFNQSLLDTLGEGQLLDYGYYPLTDWKHDYSTQKINSYLLSAELTYKPLNGLQMLLSAETLKMTDVLTKTRDIESFYTRDVINTFSQVDPNTKVVNRIVPLGDIVSTENTDVNTFTIRAQALYNKKWGDHGINLMAGIDLSDRRQQKNGQIMAGYNEDPLVHSLIDMTSLYPVWFEGYNSVGNVLQAASITGIRSFNERFIATTGSISYDYKGRYVFFSSLRKEGANILGVNTNDRWKPFWSIGVNWAIDREKFFNANWISQLNFRTNIGIRGNVDVSRSSKPVGDITQGVPNSTRSYPYLTINTPPNPNLRWEKSLDVNWALDATFLKGRISATVEYYIKRGRDLYSSVLADYTQSPSTNVQANASSMDGSGYEVRINSRVIEGTFNWRAGINFSRNRSKIKQHYNQMEGFAFNRTQGTDGRTLTAETVLFPGQSLFDITAVKTAGVNNKGQLLFLVDGKPTTNIVEVMKDFEKNGNKASSYQYFGPGSPRLQFNFNNDFNWRNWSLTVMAQFRFGYYFKKSTIDGNVGQPNPTMHKDWDLRWKKPGDELHTTIPGTTFMYYSNYSADLVKRADNIRIGNLLLNYDFPLKENSKGLKSLQLSLNVANVGIIWRANKEKLDPDYDKAGDYMLYNRPDRTWSLRLMAGF